MWKEKVDLKNFEQLIKELKDEWDNWGFRETVVKILGEIGDKRAIKILKEALNDESESVQKAAKKALENIKGK